MRGVTLHDAEGHTFPLRIAGDPGAGTARSLVGEPATQGGLLPEGSTLTLLSGTGPKAGGPHYLYRFCAEQTVTINTAAAGGNAALLAAQH